MRHLAIIALSFLLVCSICPYGQAQSENLGQAISLGISYGIQWPGADLSNRFGSNFSLGGHLEFLSNKGNWIVGAGGHYNFGNVVKQDVLSGLRTSDGGIVSTSGSFADIRLRQRGFFFGGHVGKLIGLSKVNARSGIRVTLSLGVMEHKIRIVDDPNHFVPQLSGDYKKGYDRLSRGFALGQFIGYQLLSSNGLINFFAGFESTQGFTSSVRPFNFDTGEEGASSRFDVNYGFRVGWILPFYFGKGTEEISY